MASDVAYVALGLDPQSANRYANRWKRVCENIQVRSGLKAREKEVMMERDDDQ